MKAVVLEALGEPEQLQIRDVPDPQPEIGEVVVRLHAAALNHRDVWIRRGLYAGIKLPVILGSDGCGTVESVGKDVDKKLVGSKVVINPGIAWGSNPAVQSSQFKILGLPDDGTYAQKVKVPFRNVLPIPAGLSVEEAAAIPLASLTAYRAVITRGRVSQGETVLITGIGGGVALFAMQMCLARGATVFVTSGSDEKIERARALGAAGGANYNDPEWGRSIVDLTVGGGIDVVVDSAGGDSFVKAIDIIKPGGRIVTFGATRGAAQKIEVRRIFWKQLSILGSTMGTPQEFERAVAMYAGGKMKPVIDSIHPLEDAAGAHRRMEQGDQFGKIVLRID